MRAARWTLSLLLIVASVGDAQLTVDTVGRREPRGFTIGVIDSADAGLNMASTLAHALQARLAGVSVSQGQGYLGSSSRIWLRGPSSLLVNEPLLIIDGARTHASDPYRFFFTRELPSRLEDIDMETVERVEVLRGPAAAAIYGPGASKGVILITTKRGRQGPTRWSAFAESGLLQETTDFPANFGTLGVMVSTGSPVTDCPLYLQAGGTCTPVLRRSWNPLESVSPFRTGRTTGAGLSVAGGTPRFTYFVAGSHDAAKGVYLSDGSRATSARIGITAAPTPTVDVLLTGGLRSDHLEHPADSWIQAGLFGKSTDDPVDRGYTTGGHKRASRARPEDVRRATVSLNTRWHPRSWLATSLVVGYDRLGIKSDLTFRDVLFASPEPFTFIERTDDRPESRTVALSGTAIYSIRGLRTQSSLGLEYLRDDNAAGSFDAITSDIDGRGSSQSRWIDLRRVSKGIYVQQRLLVSDRLTLVGSLRADRPTYLDIDIDDIVSRSVDVAWTAIDSTTASPWLGELRLRAAYGRGGDHNVLAANVGAFGPSDDVGSPKAPEQGAELELGFDASLLANRLRTSGTYYRGGVRRGFESIPTVQGPVLTNYAEIRTAGIEGSIEARLVAVPAFVWDAALLASAHDSEIEHMGQPPFFSGNVQFNAPGESIGAYADRPYSYADLNGDGLIATSEITLAPFDIRSAGSPFPSLEGALRTEMTFARRIHLSAIVDHRGGTKLYNATAALRCRVRCPEQNDPATPLAEQSRAPARIAGFIANGYIEDADYTKLREVRLALALPSRIARLGGASSARISVTGRNLYTWTSYTGLDPEIVSDRYDTIAAADNFYQPTLRSFVARLDLVW